MDTRSIPGTRESFGPAAELGTETASIKLPELVELRSVVVMQGGAGLRALIPAIVLTGVVAAIAVLAIATKAGWSVLAGY